MRILSLAVFPAAASTPEKARAFTHRVANLKTRRRIAA